MNKHFQYLADEPRDLFFQKIARARLEELEPGVGPDLSEPGPRALSFAKVAMRLDDDLARLEKTAMPGADAGMTKRAMAYFVAVADHVPMVPSEIGMLFDKCAAAGISADIEATIAELTFELPEEFHEKIAADLNAVGLELVRAAQMDKEAFIGGLLSGARAGARGFASGSAQLARSGVGRVQQGIGKARGGWHGFFQGRRRKALQGVQQKQQQLAKVVGTEGGGSLGAATGAVRGGAGRSLAAQEAKLQKKILKGTEAQRMAQRYEKAGLRKAVGYDSAGRAARAQPMGTPGAQVQQRQAGREAQLRAQEAPRVGQTAPAEQRRRAAAQQQAQAETQAATQGKVQSPSTTQKPPVEGAQTAGEAAQKKTQLGIVDESGQIRPAGKKGKKGKRDADQQSTGTEGPQPKPGTASAPPANAPGGVKEDPKLWDSFKRWTDGEPITAAEKGALIRAGAKGVIGYRVIMGQGAVTGGEGLI